MRSFLSGTFISSFHNILVKDAKSTLCFSKNLFFRAIAKAICQMAFFSKWLYCSNALAFFMIQTYAQLNGSDFFCGTCTFRNWFGLYFDYFRKSIF